MSFELRLPDLGEGIAEAELHKWLVAAGDVVAEHQAVAEVETDKALVELPSPVAGKVLSLQAAEGEMVTVGAVLLTIETASPAGENAERPPSYGIVGVLPEAPQEQESAIPVQAVPGVRALARERGVELARLSGSGPGGSITREDVLGAAAPAEESAAPVEHLALRGLRRTIARRLRQTQQLTACATTMEEADVTELWQLKLREEPELVHQGGHLTFLPFFLKAAQHALLEHPRFNAALDLEKEELTLFKACHIGIAVDTPEGLLVPVIRHVERKSVVQIARELQQLSARARERRIAAEELRGSTFTVTNFGAFGGSFATPILNHPNVAILGCGRIAERPWVVAGEICIRRILALSLTFDHQVVDGAEATRFLSRIARFLEDPGLLFIESV
jgi:pyruvate dehydrogenase E2 component (dihydrolipoyllysine-residue acetyltransferase)